MANVWPRTEAEKKCARPPSRLAKWLLGLAVPFVMLLAAARPLLEPLCENFHAVIPGCVYRSGQLSPVSLEDRTVRTGMRSIINLRGPNAGQDWYEQECAVARRLDLHFYDLPVDSQCPTPLELRALREVLEQCPKPVLIHCQSGIDRSGIVAAICILLLDESGSLEQARTHLSWRYGHMPWRDNVRVQNRFLEDYQRWLAERGWAHDRSRFREWLLRVSP